jgi:hypothetical protein
LNVVKMSSDTVKTGSVRKTCHADTSANLSSKKYSEIEPRPVGLEVEAAKCVGRGREY